MSENNVVVTHNHSGFYLAVVILFIACYGEPDLIDAAINYLTALTRATEAGL